jgi:hypothetical protein
MDVVFKNGMYILTDGKNIVASERNLDCLESSGKRFFAGNPTKMAEVSSAISQYRSK